MEITREYCEKLSKEEKDKLAKELLEQGLEDTFVKYLVYGFNYNDVVKETANDT